jgi:hypothetical protein
MHVLVELVLLQVASPGVGERFAALAATDPEPAHAVLRLLSYESAGGARKASAATMLVADRVPGKLVTGSEELLRVETSADIDAGTLELELAFESDHGGLEWRGAVPLGLELHAVPLDPEVLLVVSSTVVDDEQALRAVHDAYAALEEPVPQTRRARRRAIEELLGEG